MRSFTWRVRRALRHWAFVLPRVGGPVVPAEDRLVLAWVAKASRPLVDLHDPVLAREVLESLRRRIDGGEAAVETMRRKRKVHVHALHFAMERGELGSHPLAKFRWGLPKPAVSVDPRVVANPNQARICWQRSPTSGGTVVRGGAGWSGCSRGCTTRG